MSIKRRKSWKVRCGRDSTKCSWNVWRWLDSVILGIRQDIGTHIYDPEIACVPDRTFCNFRNHFERPHFFGLVCRIFVVPKAVMGIICAKLRYRPDYNVLLSKWPAFIYQDWLWTFPNMIFWYFKWFLAPQWKYILGVKFNLNTLSVITTFYSDLSLGSQHWPLHCHVTTLSFKIKSQRLEHTHALKLHQYSILFLIRIAVSIAAFPQPPCFIALFFWNEFGVIAEDIIQQKMQQALQVAPFPGRSF